MRRTSRPSSRRSRNRGWSRLPRKRRMPQEAGRKFVKAVGHFQGPAEAYAIRLCSNSSIPTALPPPANMVNDGEKTPKVLSRRRYVPSCPVESLSQETPHYLHNVVREKKKEPAEMKTRSKIRFGKPWRHEKRTLTFSKTRQGFCFHAYKNLNILILDRML